MDFQKIYRELHEPMVPSPELVRETLTKTRHRRFPLRRLTAIAAVLAVCLSVPALAAQTEPGYQLLYAASPALAQFFQPVQLRMEDNGVTMEVLSVRVEDDTAQAYISFSGDAVDSSCDLYDSWSFHLPFDQVGSCEWVDYESDTHTAIFLVTVRTMDGSPIPLGGKMTFSTTCFLSGKKKLENLALALNLADYGTPAQTTAAFSSSGGSCSGDDESIQLLEHAQMLLPGEALCESVEGLPITAAGYVDGLFHVQLCREKALELDSHARLWLEDTEGTHLESVYDAEFSNFEEGSARLDYVDFVFDVPPEKLGNYTLHGDFYTASSRTDGNWRITFLLENPWTDTVLTEIEAGHHSGSFDLQDTLLSFASRLEQEEGCSIRGAEGFQYHLLPMGERAMAEFTCPDGKLLQVWLERIPYEETDGLWRATAYAWK